MKASIIAAALAASLVAACASTTTVTPTVSASAAEAEARNQSEFVIQQRTAEYERVYSVAEKVRAANVDLCPSKAAWIGAGVETVDDYAKDLRKAAQEVLSISDQPQVTWLVKDGPADKAGLRKGDRLLAINGKDVARGPKAGRTASKMIHNAIEKDDVTLTIDRAGTRSDVVVKPAKTCSYGVSLLDDPEVNASADGEDVYITRGILHFARTDDELALVVGHELAHNAMGHMNKKRTNSILGSIGGAVVDVAFAAGGVNTNGAFTRMGGNMGAAIHSQDFEAEADYVGLYFMARAGYKMDGVEEFWRRMAAEDPKSIKLAQSHPTTASRYIAIAEARKEIEAKEAAGEELKPQMKGDAKAEDDEKPAAASKQGALTP